MSESVPSRQSDDTATLLPVVADSGNRRMLTDWITSHDRYELAEGSPDTATFDLCILDGEMLEREQTALKARKRETSATARNPESGAPARHPQRHDSRARLARVRH